MDNNLLGYTPDPKYSKAVAYFSMEFAIEQCLKIYSGGLGFLAGSHLRSAHELQQNLVGVGIRWKYGYYDQRRTQDMGMQADFIRKDYPFLENAGVVFSIPVQEKMVSVAAYLLRPKLFGTAPLFLLSTDLPENDDFSRRITDRLYDPDERTRIAQSIILGIGGAMLLDRLGIALDMYHMNEGHAAPLIFYLHSKLGNLEEVKKKIVFTTHTPEKAGNEEHHFELLKEMSFFYHMQVHEVKSFLQLEGDYFNYTLGCLKSAGMTNAVSKLHRTVTEKMWSGNDGISEIISITNAQNKKYWQDRQIAEYLLLRDDAGLADRKRALKTELFKMVADQTGRLFDPNVLTIVWSRRFAAYKRADLLLLDWERFLKLIGNRDRPVQMIWAGKPYPEDANAIALFNRIIEKTVPFANCAVLTGYELGLSAMLKKGADIWLNNPRMFSEASGTSGMTAAMNLAVNLSLPDGWVPEFAKDRENCFLIQPAPVGISPEEADRLENSSLMEMLETVVVPMYYDNPADLLTVAKNAVDGVIPQFESGRMVKEYYEKMYAAQ
jgi:starch phosphorylase